MIRRYRTDDYEMLCDWWREAGMTPPTRNMLPEQTTWICERLGVPMVSACLYLMNCKDASMVEHVIGNPKYKGIERSNALDELLHHLEKEAKDRGYRVLVIFSYNEKVKARYLELGFKNTLNNVSTFAKAIGG